MPDTTTTETATITTVFGGLETLVTGALGDHESAAVKARVHALTATLGALGDVLEPVLAERVDAPALISGIQKVENGAASIEAGVQDVLGAIKGVKKDAGPSTGTPGNGSVTGSPKIN